MKRIAVIAYSLKTSVRYADQLRSLFGSCVEVVSYALEKGIAAPIQADIALISAHSIYGYVEEKLAQHSDYKGFLVIWDEFTDVMKSDIGLSLLVDLQRLADETMNAEHNSYLFFISHPSALNSLKAEERDKTKGRYIYMKYNMEPVSAFKIMSRKFKLVGTED